MRTYQATVGVLHKPVLKIISSQLFFALGHGHWTKFVDPNKLEFVIHFS